MMCGSGSWQYSVGERGAGMCVGVWLWRGGMEFVRMCEEGKDGEIMVEDWEVYDVCSVCVIVGILSCFLLVSLLHITLHFISSLFQDCSFICSMIFNVH
jgi:hypothetical protein